MQRPDVYVIVRFLERLSEYESPPLKTELQLRVRVNYTIFQRYLEWLVRKEYVGLELDGDQNERVRLAPKGRAAFATLREWVRDALE